MGKNNSLHIGTPSNNQNPPIFESMDRFKVSRGIAFVVNLDRTTYDFEHIIGKEIIIDGDHYIGIGVDRYAHVPPWHVDSPIAILVKETIKEVARR